MKNKSDILEEMISKAHAQVEVEGGVLRSRQVRAALDAVAEQLALLHRMFDGQARPKRNLEGDIL